MKLAERINKLGEYLNNNIYSVFLYIIAALNILPILAPLLAKLGMIFPAKAIYFMYSFFCHQLHWRSLHVCDNQYGWCSRCTAIWINVLITGIIVKFFRLKPIKWYWILILILPMALDGIIQTVATMLGFSTHGEIYYMSNNLVRIITGSMFGIGFGLWVWTSLAETLSSKEQQRKKPMSLLRAGLISAIISLLFFILAFLLWHLTSPDYPPANLLDFAVKTPVLPQEFLIRRENGL